MSRRIKVSCLFLAAISTNYVLGADRSNDRFRGACTVEDLESGEVNTTYFDLDRHQSSRGSVAIASLDGWSYYVDLSFETINAGGGGSLVAMYVKNYKPWDQYNTFQKVEVINPVLDEDINIQGIYQTDKNIYQISTVKASCTGQVINVPSQVEDLINISLKTVLLDKDTEKLEVNIPYEGDKCKARIDFNFGNKSPYINLAKFTEDIDSVFDISISSDGADQLIAKSHTDVIHLMIEEESGRPFTKFTIETKRPYYWFTKRSYGSFNTVNYLQPGGVSFLDLLVVGSVVPADAQVQVEIKFFPCE